MITGDAMGKPLIEALDEPGASYDLSSLIGFTSTAALFSPAVKDEFFRHFPNLIMTDAIGSSESGNNGITRVQPGATAMKGGPTVTAVGESVVFDDALNLVEPGLGCHRQDRPGRQHPPRLLQRSQEDGRGLHHRRRQALRHAR